MSSRAEAWHLVDNARDPIDLLTTMDEDARRRPAVELLVAKAG